jgi:ATP-binding cassette, subfamily B, bacterial PglK
MRLTKKIFFLLIGDYKRQAALLVLMMIFGTILEVAGIGLVIPLLSFLIDKNAIIENQFIQSFIPNNVDLSQVNFLVWGMSILIVVYIIKTVFLTFLSWRISKTVYGLEEKLSKELYKKYLNQSFAFHLEHNSGQLIQNVSGEVNQLASIIMGGLNLIAEIFVVLGIAILLLLIEPLGTFISIFILIVFSFLYFSLFKGRLLIWGQQRQAAEGKRIQHLQQGFGGIKDVKLFGSANQLLSSFSIHNTMFTKMNMLQHFFNTVPRFFIELIAVLILGFLFIILSLDGNIDPKGLIPIVGLFAVAAFRLMPSANRILVSVQTLRYATPIINTVFKELTMQDDIQSKNKSETLIFNKTISFSNVSFSYLKTKSNALNNINFEIAKGSCIGIIGKSGSGKSTLINLLLGLLNPTKGNILIDETDLQENIRGLQDQIGYVPQDIFLLDDTLRNNIAYGVNSTDIDFYKIEKAIELSQLKDYIDNLHKGLDSLVGERGVKISGGQRQRIGIARALYNDPNILVLDEATSALDGNTEKELMDAINKLHGIKTIIIVAHRLSTIKNCDYIYKLENGEIVNKGNDLGEIAK